jgi:hypothetical protein
VQTVDRHEPPGNGNGGVSMRRLRSWRPYMAALLTHARAFAQVTCGVVRKTSAILHGFALRVLALMGHPMEIEPARNADQIVHALRQMGYHAQVLTDTRRDRR